VAERGRGIHSCKPTVVAVLNYGSKRTTPCDIPPVTVACTLKGWQQKTNIIPALATPSKTFAMDMVWTSRATDATPLLADANSRGNYACVSCTCVCILQDLIAGNQRHLSWFRGSAFMTWSWSNKVRRLISQAFVLPPPWPPPALLLLSPRARNAKEPKSARTSSKNSYLAETLALDDVWHSSKDDSTGQVEGKFAVELLARERWEVLSPTILCVHCWCHRHGSRRTWKQK